MFPKQATPILALATSLRINYNNLPIRMTRVKMTAKNHRSEPIAQSESTVTNSAAKFKTFFLSQRKIESTLAINNVSVLHFVISEPLSLALTVSEILWLSLSSLLLFKPSVAFVLSALMVALDISLYTFWCLKVCACFFCLL